ncbi:MAG: winged helix-turn-helix domain-containing protein [Chloroflexota bacterium]|nr:winged helix-turn-helix domain-containing protein [Chloroflexota bacterium]
MARRTAKNLQDSLRDVERDVQECTARLEQLRQYANWLRQMIAFYDDSEDGAATDVVDGSALRRSSVGLRTPPQAAKVARNALFEILRDAGRPMHSRDLLASLEERGVQVVGKDPVNNVRSHLSHDTRFRSVGGGEWDLASRSRAAGPNTVPPAIWSREVAPPSTAPVAATVPLEDPMRDALADFGGDRWSDPEQAEELEEVPF